MDSVHNRILAALGTKGDWVPSTRVLQELGISRMAVCKQVRRLRTMGYEIEAAPRLGYRLVARTGSAVPGEVLPRLRTKHVLRTYLYFPELDSTNEFLRKQLATLGEGTVVVAGSQTQGRGRFHREWFSPSGVNIYLSVLLKPAVSPLRVPELSLVAAAAVLRAVHAEGCSEAGVKWPNDILWRGKKLAGILCEMEAETDLVHAVIVGIGINVNMMTFPGPLKQTATSLRRALGRPVSVPALTAEILNRLDEAYGDWLRDGLGPVVAFLSQHSVLTGCEVKIALPRGEVVGRAEGITELGALRVVQADGVAQDITSGEVQLCRPVVAKSKGDSDE